MAVSAKLRDMVRDATLGMSDVDVCERTGITYATWRRMLAGHVPSGGQLIKFALGMELDPQAYLDAAAEVRPRASKLDVLRYVLEDLELPTSVSMQIMQLVRGTQSDSITNQSTA